MYKPKCRKQGKRRDSDEAMSRQKGGGKRRAKDEKTSAATLDVYKLNVATPNRYCADLGRSPPRSARALRKGGLNK